MTNKKQSSKVFLNEGGKVRGAFINKDSYVQDTFSHVNDKFDLTVYIKNLIANVLSGGTTVVFTSITAFTANIGKNLFGFGTATAPSISFNTDADTGFYRSAANTIGVASTGNKVAEFDAEGLVVNEVSELTSGAGVVVQHGITTGITAFATGGQANAVELSKEYSVLGTVGTTGDSVKLPATTLVGKRFVIKNAGANDADVFPSTGGDLGAGANTAVSLAAGATITYVCTAANVFVGF